MKEAMRGGRVDFVNNFVANKIGASGNGKGISIVFRRFLNPDDFGGAYEDEVRESLPRNKALANGPQENGESFVVPRIIT